MDHDDGGRGYSYIAQSGTVDFEGDFVEFGRDLGWTIASIRDDWATVFPN